MPERPNLLFIFADQLRACSLPLYGESQIETPGMDRLAAEGVTFTNSVSSCPVCTPYRSMLLTGRHPQTTGHLINFVRTRHDEISLGDCFGRAGYRTGWVGKWHLHTGSFPQVPGMDYVPEGRDRLGFDYWRGYNFHCRYFQGWVNRGDWRNETWEGYETDALARYAAEFLDSVGDEPFCLFVSPHQPHFTGESDFAPRKYYDMLPDEIELRANCSGRWLEDSGAAATDWMAPASGAYRHYLAMTLAVDDMVGRILSHLEGAGLAENTLVVFTSDHGSQMGSQGIHPWAKRQPYEESMLVPMIARMPGVLAEGATCDGLFTAVDHLPTLAALCGVDVPSTAEGMDLSAAWRGEPGAPERADALTMNFSSHFDYLVDGSEWRGVRTKPHSYARWLDGRAVLYDLEADPLETTNLADDPAAAGLRAELERRMQELLAERGDDLRPSTSYADWYDQARRIVRNAYGPLGDPEAGPDWSRPG